MEMIIIGAGGHAKVVLDAALLQARYKVIALIDENAQLEHIRDIPVLERIPQEIESCHFIIAIGDNFMRRREYLRMLDNGFQPATVIHPSATISEDSQIREGTIICANSFIGPGARVGVNCIVNTAASVDHDCTLGDHAHVSAGVHLGGASSVGEGVLLGLGVVTVPKVTIGDWAVAGVGAAIIRDVEPNSTVVGVPAKEIDKGFRGRAQA